MSAEATALTPTVLWAERKDKARRLRLPGTRGVHSLAAPPPPAQVYVTIEVQDCSKEGTTVSLQPDGGLTFRGVSGGGQAYALDLQLARGVDADGSKIAVTPRGVLLVVAKSAADASGPRWGRLLAAPGKPPHYVKVDWSKCARRHGAAARAGAGRGRESRGRRRRLARPFSGGAASAGLTRRAAQVRGRGRGGGRAEQGCAGGRGKALPPRASLSSLPRPGARRPGYAPAAPHVSRRSHPRDALGDTSCCVAATRDVASPRL